MKRSSRSIKKKTFMILDCWLGFSAIQLIKNKSKNNPNSRLSLIFSHNFHRIWTTFISTASTWRKPHFRSRTSSKRLTFSLWWETSFLTKNSTSLYSKRFPSKNTWFIKSPFRPKLSKLKRKNSKSFSHKSMKVNCPKFKNLKKAMWSRRIPPGT